MANAIEDEISFQQYMQRFEDAIYSSMQYQRRYEKEINATTEEKTDRCSDGEADSDRSDNLN